MRILTALFLGLMALSTSAIAQAKFVVCDTYQELFVTLDGVSDILQLLVEDQSVLRGSCTYQRLTAYSYFENDDWWYHSDAEIYRDRNQPITNEMVFDVSRIVLPNAAGDAVEEKYIMTFAGLAGEHELGARLFMHSGQCQPDSRWNGCVTRQGKLYLRAEIGPSTTSQ